jgi:hypothetical protein
MGIGVNPTFWRSSDETSPIFKSFLRGDFYAQASHLSVGVRQSKLRVAAPASMPVLRVNGTGIHAEIFVPLCASFVPWSF